MRAALADETVQLQEATRVIRSGGLLLTVVPSTQGVSMEDHERRGPSAGRRWSDEDHDELIRHGEILRSINSTMTSLFTGLGETRSDTAALTRRVAEIEGKEHNRQGYEAAMLAASKTAATRQATLVGGIIAVVSAIISVLGPRLLH